MTVSVEKEEIILSVGHGSRLARTFGIRRFGINYFHGQGHLYLAGRVLRFVLASCFAFRSRERLGTQPGNFQGHLYLAGRVLRFVLAKDWGRSLETSKGTSTWPVVFCALCSRKTGDAAWKLPQCREKCYPRAETAKEKCYFPQLFVFGDRWRRVI